MLIKNVVLAGKSVDTASLFQKILLTAGSGFIAINDPTRADMLNALGELTSEKNLKKLYNIMKNDTEGSLILSEKPIINSKSIDLNYLDRLPKNTFGKEYLNFLIKNNITPDSRLPVYFIKNKDLAYVMTRYRQIHDFTHCLLGLNTNMIGEVTVKIYEAIQLGFPMCWLGGLFGVIRLGPKHTDLYINKYLPWIIDNGKNSKLLLNIYFEKNFEKPIDQLRYELNLKKLK
jgi:ubiquinone biosynthesis protein COQ4